MAVLVTAVALVAQVLAADAGGPAEVQDDPPAVDVAPVDEATPVPVVADSRPIGGALGARIYCIEGHESGHSGTAYNRRSGASGWLQWLPSTARAWGVVIGDRQSEWSGAARIAARGERFFISQWVPLQLGLC